MLSATHCDYVSYFFLTRFSWGNGKNHWSSRFLIGSCQDYPEDAFKPHLKLWYGWMEKLQLPLMDKMKNFGGNRIWKIVTIEPERLTPVQGEVVVQRKSCMLNWKSRREDDHSKTSPPREKGDLAKSKNNRGNLKCGCQSIYSTPNQLPLTWIWCTPRLQDLLFYLHGSFHYIHWIICIKNLPQKSKTGLVPPVSATCHLFFPLLGECHSYSVILPKYIPRFLSSLDSIPLTNNRFPFRSILHGADPVKRHFLPPSYHPDLTLLHMPQE